MSEKPHLHPSAIRRFLAAQSSAGIVLMGAAVAALLIANSPLGPGYARMLHVSIGPLSIGHWINDGFMTVFFLLVGLEIKREMLDGQLSTWPRRILPGIAAAGGMVVPALIYLHFNQGATAAGWAIPAATDIAFALGVIALFYTAVVSLPALAGAVVAIGALAIMNQTGIRRLSPYLVVGMILWLLVLWSGVHATLTGVMLALTIPMDRTPGRADADCRSPLHRLEEALHRPVAFVILPIFGLANAAVPILELPAGAFVAPVTLGGVALLCGVGFTMSLLITLLAFPGTPLLESEAKVGVLAGSLISGLLGYAILRVVRSEHITGCGKIGSR